jgi:hypothetical protein
MDISYLSKMIAIDDSHSFFLQVMLLDYQVDRKLMLAHYNWFFWKLWAINVIQRYLDGLQDWASTWVFQNFTTTQIHFLVIFIIRANEQSFVLNVQRRQA